MFETGGIQHLHGLVVSAARAALFPSPWKVGAGLSSSWDGLGQTSISLVQPKLGGWELGSLRQF